MTHYQYIRKILCSYITDRTARIKVENYIGPKIELKSGVPQGGILSPTLYIMYIRDMPTPNGKNMNIGFADDVTQVIQNFSNDKHKLSEDTITEIERLNIYERKWKIQTNLTKFNIFINF